MNVAAGNASIVPQPYPRDVESLRLSHALTLTEYDLAARAHIDGSQRSDPSGQQPTDRLPLEAASDRHGRPGTEPLADQVRDFTIP